jgi:hypothetical protein
VTRHVRTAAGAKRYGLPIGSPIVPGAARAKIAGEAARAATKSTPPAKPLSTSAARDRFDSMTAGAGAGPKLPHPKPPDPKAGPNGAGRPAIVGRLHQMVDVSTDSHRSRDYAQGLKGRELDEAVAALPPSYTSGLSKSSKADAKRAALVRWATSSTQVNSEAIRSGVSRDNGPGHMDRIRAAEASARHAELDARHGPADPSKRARDLMAERPSSRR